MNILSMPVPDVDSDSAPLDRLTSNPANYWLGLITNAGLSLILLALGFARTKRPLMEAAALLIMSALAYSFLEYAFHRWLYHGRTSAASRIHGRHHENAKRLIGSPILMWPLLSVAAWALACCFMEAGLGAILSGTLLLGAACHRSIHYFIHHGRIRASSPFGSLRRRHLLHHRLGNANFGVTSPLWDLILGTAR